MKKLEFAKKLESEVLVFQVCDQHRVKKQTVSDIGWSKDKLTGYETKSDVASSTQQWCRR